MLEPVFSPEPAANDQEYLRIVAEIRGHLEAVRDLPALPAFRESRTLPEAFFTRFNAALAAYDRLIDFALGFDGSTDRIKCTKGCANCCIDLVRGITTPEIANIYHHVRPWPDAKQIFEYHRESAETFSLMLAAKIDPNESEISGRDERVAETHVEYNRLNRPCGFLDQATGCCRIYPVRPLACRYFFSISPPETCNPLHVLYLNRQTRTVHLPEEIHALIREIDIRFGFRPLNFLSGAFCQFTAETMRLKMINVTPA